MSHVDTKGHRDEMSSLPDQWSTTSRLGNITTQLLERVTRWDIVFAGALMAIVSFSLPGRATPGISGGIDLIAIAKFAIRLAVLVWFGSIMFMHCFRSMTTRSKRLGRPIAEVLGEYLWTCSWTDRLLLPWWCYAGWSLICVIWSPLFSVSLGQWLGLVALLAFAQVISNRYSSSNSFDWHVLARQISAILTIYCLIILVVHLIAPGVSGLDRSISVDGNNGLFHPTAVGAASSLGFTIAIVLYLQRVNRNTPLTFSIILLHLVVLYLSASRSALAMAVIVGLVCFTFLMSKFHRASLLLLCGLGLLLMVLTDPGFELAELGIRDASAYVQRGQSVDQLREVSGRAELWAAVWEQFKLSPLVGHGYFVTSSSGKLDVWESPSNQDAHNVVLQVLVSTGLVGGMIFAWAIIVSCGHLIRNLFLMMPRWYQFVLGHSSSMKPLSVDPKPERLRIDNHFTAFSFIVMIWFAGWTQGCVSFLGPIRPEVVAFFSLLGLLSAHARLPASEGLKIGGLGLERKNR